MPETLFPVAVVADQPFDTRGARPLLADLFLPREVPGRVPVIIWVHGGGWLHGSRHYAPDLRRFFAGRGLAMVAIDYRLSHRSVFPAQAEDVRTAVRWVRSVADTFGFDADRIGLWGASAGGHLAALAALCPPGLFEPPGVPHREQPGAVQAVVTGYAPIDFLQLDRDRPEEGTLPADPENLPLPAGMRSADPDSFESLLLGAPIDTCRERVREANPITYARPGAPPFLILHGLSDTTVGSHQSELLYDALAAHGNDVTLCLIERLGHGFLNRNHVDDRGPWPMVVRSRREGVDRTERVEREIFPTIEAFFRRHLLRPSAPPC